MIESETITFNYPNGECQRVQKVILKSWSQLEFFSPSYSEKSFERLCSLYEKYIIPRCPWIFGKLILFRIPDDMDVPFPYETGRYGRVSDKLTAAAIALRSGVTIVGRKPLFLSGAVKDFWRCLEKTDCVKVICGHLPNTTVIPVNNCSGFLSENEGSAAVKLNSSFFTMDRFDCASAYDAIGVPFGLLVKDGFVSSPPLYMREALFIKKDGDIAVRVPALSDLIININGTAIHPDNTNCFVRPACRITPEHSGKDLVIIGTKVAAVHNGGHTFVPASGFVIRDDNTDASPGDSVIYHGYEDVLFAVQAGNSTVVDGEKTSGFRSPFYNIKKLWSTSYPPSLYPLDYDNDRAPRMSIGADASGNPVIIWAEGAGKLSYSPGTDSCGASLSEMADICKKLGLVNAVNLDGGGSAQILVNNRRSLLISDRNPDNSEAERAVPIGLIVR